MFWPIDTLNGYRARLDDYTLHELVRYDPGVESVEHDSYGEPILEHERGETVQLPDSQPSKLPRRWAQTVHTGYHWWSVMISAGKKLDAPLPPKGDYVRTFQVTATMTDRANEKVQELLDNAGDGVDLYIFDTGVRTSHVDFLDWAGRGPSRASNFQGMTFSKYVNETMVMPSSL